MVAIIFSPAVVSECVLDLSQGSTSFQPINDTFNFQFLEEDEGALSGILIASGVRTI